MAEATSNGTDRPRGQDRQTQGAGPGAEEGAKKDSFLTVFRRNAVMVMCHGADEGMIMWGVTVLNSGMEPWWPLSGMRRRERVLEVGTAGRWEVEGVPFWLPVISR